VRKEEEELSSRARRNSRPRVPRDASGFAARRGKLGRRLCLRGESHSKEQELLVQNQVLYPEKKVGRAQFGLLCMD
jgi:hypothetical protein